MGISAHRDLALVDGELVIKDGDLAVVRGKDAIAQAVYLRLSFFQGEWFLDSQAGIPWFEKALVKGPRLALVRSTVRKELLSVQGVNDVLQLDLDLSAQTRTLSITFRVSTDLGEIQGTI